MSDLLEWLRQQYPQVRELPDGSIAAVVPLLTTTGLILGLTRYGYERRFCFESHELAMQRFNELQSEDDEPAGWVARRPATDPQALRVWTVYEHPADYPDKIVARLWVMRNGEVRATGDVLISPDLGVIRERLASQGLSCLSRAEEDDPCIVETWL